MALTHDTLDLVRVLCDVTLRMIEGELYQLTKNGDADITEDEHFDIIRRKTAYLFGGCAQIGGMLGKVTPRAGRGAARLRLQSRHRLSAGGRPARLHRRRRGARQADRRRPARRQDDAAAHPPARAGREAGAERSCARSSPRRTATDEQWTELLGILREHRSIDYADRRAVEFAERAKKPLYVVSAERRARCAAGAARLRALARPLTAWTAMSTTLLSDVITRLERRCVMRSAITKSATTSTTIPRSPTRSSTACCTSWSSSKPTIRISSRPTRRPSASPAARSRGSRRSSTSRRCSASTTPTRTTSCARSTSGCARAPDSAIRAGRTTSPS